MGLFGKLFEKKECAICGGEIGLLGNRKLGAWVTSMSAEASDMSGWMLMGVPGYAYLAGLNAGWIAVGIAIGTWANWHFVAARLRKYTELANNSLTLPDLPPPVR